MEPITINEFAGQVSAQLNEKLGAKGATLEKRLAYVQRTLPRRVRRSGEALVAAQQMGQNPQLAMRVDSNTVAKSYDEISRYLDEVDAGLVRSRKRYNVAAGVAGQVLMVTFAFAAVLMWRGLI